MAPVDDDVSYYFLLGAHASLVAALAELAGRFCADRRDADRLPPVAASAAARWLPSSTAVYDDHGRLLRLTLASDDRYRLWVPLKGHLAATGRWCAAA
jgi:membrane carboxypeptidase/penicillin-binding protein PbpC